MASGSSKRRCHLSLQKKFEVIEKAKSSPGTSVRALGELFGCGKSQISDILKNKSAIVALYESNASSSLKHTKMKPRVSEYSEINDALHQWYLLACSKNIYPAGPQLMEKAREIAVRLGKPEFKGTNGWLEKWKKRFNIKSVAICGESGDVRGDTVESWRERLPEILRGYRKEDIYNLDETGCFWRALPEKGFGEKGKKCKGGKKSKHRVTVAFLVNAAGDKEDPIVIWKSENPRCFRGLQKSSLPVKYFHQKKAWMTGEILDVVLTSFNRRMSHAKRYVLLLIDNAGCHPEELKGKYSNVKVVFLPPNTTSKLQPLDLGIIQNFKTHYRRLLLRYVLAKIDSCSCASEVAKSVNILTAIRWISQAWKEVKPDTITKCFKSCGILTDEMSVSSRDEEDPFQDIDAGLELSGLISSMLGTEGHCSADEYVNGDNNIPTCVEIDDENWEETFLESLAANNVSESLADEDESDTEDLDLQPPPPKIGNYREAIESLEEIRNFLESHAHFTEASTANSLIDQVAQLHSAGVKQSTLHDYFRPCP